MIYTRDLPPDELSYPDELITRLSQHALVFMPTAAGKSTLTRTHPDLFVDGDHIIAKGPGWPSDRRWWATYTTEQRKRVHAVNARALINFEKNQTLEGEPKTILFNGNIDAFAQYPEFTDWIKRSDVIIFIPSEARHKRYGELRAASGNTSQPSEWGTLSANRDKLIASAIHYAIIIIHENGMNKEK